MSRFGRRTFLASSAGVAAGAAASAALPVASVERSGAAARPTGTAGSDLTRARGPLRAGGLTVNGLTDPVGIDPDGCFFAWTLQGPGRAVAQTASRIVVRRTDPTRTGVVWASGSVASARQAFVAYGGAALAADAAYEWTVQAQGAAGWGPESAPARFTTALRDAGLAGPVATPGRRFVTTRSRDLPAHRGRAACGHGHPRHRLPLRRSHLQAVRGRKPGRRLAELLLPRRAVRAHGGPHRCDHRGAAQRPRRAAPLVRARPGAPGLLPRPALPTLRLVWRWPARRLRVGRDLARAPGRVVAVAAAQQRRR